MRACINFVPVIVMIFLGCAAGRAVKADEKPDLKYSTGMYLTAEGIGRTEADAKDNALAEMSRMFEARIKSESLDRVKSVIKGADGEKFEQSLEQKISVVSQVELKGVSIVKTWKSDGNYHAVAALDRTSAREEWREEIRGLDSKVEAEIYLSGSASSGFMRLRHLNEAAGLWVKRQVAEGRLRVIGFEEPEPYDIRPVFRTMSEIKPSIAVFIEVKGEHGETVKRVIAEAVGKAGLPVSDDIERADVVISGEVETKALEAVAPGVTFTRSIVSLSVLDKDTALTVGKASSSEKSGHPDAGESAVRAVRSASTGAMDKIIKLFEEAP